MILKMYSIKDELNGFTPAISMPNEETAKRWYNEMKETNTTIKMQLKDFSLWHLGEFDTETGETKNNVRLVERS